MQNAVEKILEGNFNKGIRALDFSSPVIELNLREGENYEGSFTIVGPDNEVSEGIISSTSLRMKCLAKRFSGQKEEIGYQFDASGMAEGDELKGEFRIISNQGEYFIPYNVSITKGVPDSELGNIRNLFHFANLARTNWEEAVSLFYSRDFKNVFQGADRQYYSAYKGLLEGSRKQQCVEEFLLEIRKKQEVLFLLEDTKLRIENPEDMEENKLVLNRNGWGYSELFVEKEGDFIVLEKEAVRDEDFLGNCYRLPFYVSKEKLHPGRNYGMIRFYNPYVSLTAEITVINKSDMVKKAATRRQKKHMLMELMQYYEAFRTKKISAASWMKETGELVEGMIQLDEKDISVRLFQAQLLITQERFNEAKWNLDQAAEALGREYEPALYCYYLYLTTLLNRPEEEIEEAASQVERIFAQNSDNWRIAWLLLYLSGEYTRSPSRKWIMLGDQFLQGCRSPLLYIEAWNLVAANPTLLLRLEDFELQILTYASKKELLTAEVIGQTVYLSQRQKNYSGRLLYILKCCYKKVPTDEVLQAICTLLIKGNMTCRTAFAWYEKGVARELRITRLYEYYMMSLPLTYDAVIPKIVLMYFAFDSTLDSLRNAFLYAYVYRNRGQYPELYESYREQIERFMVFQLIKEKNNEYLAVLYKNLITPMMITEDTAKGLSVALFIHHLTIKREDIRKVILVYEKEKAESIYPVTGREAYIPIYGNDFRLLLEDAAGNRYCREQEYVVERLLIPDKLSSMIAPYVTDCVHFDLWLCERGRGMVEINDENVEYMKRLSGKEEVVEEVKREIRMRLVQFFYDSDRMKDLDDFLDEITPDQIENRSYTPVVRFMVIRGMYDKAYEWLKARGGAGVEAKLVVKLCSRLLSMDGIVEDEAMTALVFQAFQAGKYDESLLIYLCRYFKGTSKEMRDIWKAAEAFGVDTYELCERILLQLIYTGAYIGEKSEIFRCYVSGGAKTEVELAFLAQCGYDYFVENGITSEFVLEDMQRVIDRQEEIPFICKLAYTKYYAENKKQVDEKISRYLVIFLWEILMQGKYFPYFMEYADNIAFMHRFADKTMVEYRVKDGNRAVIHYLLEKEGNSQGEYIKEEMQEMFGGICVKQFILFFGEHLQYYITETENGKENLTQSGTLSRNETGGEQKEGRYGMLNDIAIGRNLHDYDTMESLLYEYFEQDYIVKEMFKMI